MPTMHDAMTLLRLELADSLQAQARLLLIRLLLPCCRLLSNYERQVPSGPYKYKKASEFMMNTCIIGIKQHVAGIIAAKEAAEKRVVVLDGQLTQVMARCTPAALYQPAHPSTCAGSHSMSMLHVVACAATQFRLVRVCRRPGRICGHTLMRPHPWQHSIELHLMHAAATPTGAPASRPGVGPAAAAVSCP
jgi:hypothetical protein